MNRGTRAEGLLTRYATRRYLLFELVNPSEDVT